MKENLVYMDERPKTIPAICATVEEPWRNITDEEIREIVGTMPARIQAVIAAYGGHTRYQIFSPFVLIFLTRTL